MGASGQALSSCWIFEFVDPSWISANPNGNISYHRVGMDAGMMMGGFEVPFHASLHILCSGTQQPPNQRLLHNWKATTFCTNVGLSIQVPVLRRFIATITVGILFTYTYSCWFAHYCSWYQRIRFLVRSVSEPGSGTAVNNRCGSHFNSAQTSSVKYSRHASVTDKPTACPPFWATQGIRNLLDNRPRF